MAKGRVTKLTPERQQRIVTMIAAGLTKEVAAISAGISRTTFFAWQAKGQASRSGIHKDFSDAVEKAEADAELLAVGRIRLAGQGGQIVARTTKRRLNKDGEVTSEEINETYTRPEWTADAWWLERKYPERWGRRLVINLERERILEDTRALAVERGLDPDAAVKEVEVLLLAAPTR